MRPRTVALLGCLAAVAAAAVIATGTFSSTSQAASPTKDETAAALAASTAAKNDAELAHKRAVARAKRRVAQEAARRAEQQAALAQVAPSQSAPSGGGDASGLPSCTWAPESGGDYNASNPSGAYGKYQIMPQTAADNGCDLSTPGGQDACAVKIYDGGRGAGNWVNC